MQRIHPQRSIRYADQRPPVEAGWIQLSRPGISGVIGSHHLVRPAAPSPTLPAMTVTQSRDRQAGTTPAADTRPLDSA